jgi:prolyl-tRNA synthetase
VLAK